MLENDWSQKGLRISLQCIHVHKTDFAKDVVLLLSMKFHDGCYLICMARWIAAIVWSVFLQDEFWKMLYGSLFQSFGSATHLLAITVEQ